MTAWQTLVELVEHRARAAPDAPVFTFLGDGALASGALTSADLRGRARGIAALLRTAVTEQDAALLLLPPGLDYVCAFLGCLYARVVAVPAYPPSAADLVRTSPRLAAIAESAAPACVLTTRALAALSAELSARAPALSRLRWLVVDDAGLEGAALPEARPDDVAFVQYTSGSTATPRGVVLSHANLVANLRATRLAFDCQPGDRALFWLPPYHDMGLIGGILGTLAFDCHAHLMSPMVFLKRPERWLEGLSRHRVTITGAPDFAYALCVRRIADEQRARLDLSCVRLAFCGAEPIRAETIDAFVERFGPVGFSREAFYPCYGLAEATLIVTGATPGRGPQVGDFDAAALEGGRLATPAGARAKRLVSVGRPPPGLDLRVVEPASGEVLPEGHVGEIWVRGASVARGYHRDESATREAFGWGATSGPQREEGFLRTGDLGALQAGELFVTGRRKDLLIVRGRNVHPQDLEHSAFGCAGVRPGGAVAFALADERVGVAVEPAPGADGTLVRAAVRDAILREHQVDVQVFVLRRGELPKTSSGKVMRGAARALVESFAKADE